jgi:hypothetical protein
VNAFVIATILALILVANVVVALRRAPPVRVVYLALLAWILGTWAIGLDGLMTWSSPARNWAAVLILCMPLFFAGIIFASHIAREAHASVALGSNMLGAVVGGVLEYTSMLWGLRALYLLAALLYALSWVSLLRRAAPPSRLIPA